jgi:glutamate/tyrosine decarboxylase-like PLP-dependent enzyme
VPVYAALRHLGRRGVADLVDRCCDLARRMADLLAASPHLEIVNQVVLDQVLVRFSAPGRDGDELTPAVIRRVQEERTCWLGGTTWKGRAAMRVSVINATTTAADVDRSAAAILGCLEAELGERGPAPADAAGSGAG